MGWQQQFHIELGHELDQEIESLTRWADDEFGSAWFSTEPIPAQSFNEFRRRLDRAQGKAHHRAAMRLFDRFNRGLGPTG